RRLPPFNLDSQRILGSPHRDNRGGYRATHPPERQQTGPHSSPKPTPIHLSHPIALLNSEYTLRNWPRAGRLYLRADCVLAIGEFKLASPSDHHSAPRAHLPYLLTAAQLIVCVSSRT